MGALVVVVGVVLVGVVCGGVVSRRRSNKQVPPTPPFARPKGRSTSLRTTLRRDGNAAIGLDEWSYLWRRDRRYWFMGTGCPPQLLSREQWERLHRDQAEGPVLVAISDDRQFWWWRDEFYWENGQYSAEDVRAVVLEQRRRNQKQLERAHTVLATD